ncbi:hypothetical protein EYR40_009105 [Pleurotus pulmonarius]|nr:hypothetical protein EYR40_009105 [Pleurotus pulmonarius]
MFPTVFSLPPTKVRGQGEAGLPSIHTVFAQHEGNCQSGLAPAFAPPSSDLILPPIDIKRQGPSTLPPILDVIPELRQIAHVLPRTAHRIPDSSSSRSPPRVVRNSTAARVALAPLSAKEVARRDAAHTRLSQYCESWRHLSSRPPARSATSTSSQSVTPTGASPQNIDGSPDRPISRVLLPDGDAILRYLRREPEYLVDDKDNDLKADEELLRDLVHSWMAQVSTADEEVAHKEGHEASGAVSGRREEQGVAVRLVHSPRPKKLLRFVASQLEAKAGLYLPPLAGIKVDRDAGQKRGRVRGSLSE